jgi:hypothetical protein
MGKSKQYLQTKIPEQYAPPSGRFRRRRIELPPPLATKAGRKKLQDATVAHHQKNTNNPNEEDGGLAEGKTTT